MTPKKLKPNTAGIVQQCMSASRKFLSENKRYPSIRELSIALGISEGTAPNTGFQIGGYYSHIHFEYNKEEPNGCMEMIIHSDGEFPTEEIERQIQFHICDFRQLEHFVKEWGEYFRKIGVVSDSD